MRAWTASENFRVLSSLYYVIAQRSTLEQLALQCMRWCGWIQLARRARTHRVPVFLNSDRGYGALGGSKTSALDVEVYWVDRDTDALSK